MLKFQKTNKFLFSHVENHRANIQNLHKQAINDKS